MNTPWLEKYRPENLSQVYGNRTQLDTLRCAVEQGSIPNMILTGPPGVGKTSSVLCIARQLLGSQFDQGVKELNASDERGIDVVREQIKAFAMKKVTLPEGRCKIIILDEADSMTEGAQQALRMIISNFTQTTRFVLSCNNSSKIIEPIQSRCLMIRFNKLTDEEMKLNLDRVFAHQNVKIQKEALNSLVFIADGDMRSAINNVEACYYAAQGSVITEEIVLSVCDAPSAKQIEGILIDCATGKLRESLDSLHQLMTEGHSAFDVAGAMQRVLISLDTHPSRPLHKDKLIEMLKGVAQLKKRILDGLTTELQIAQFLSACSMIET